MSGAANWSEEELAQYYQAQGKLLPEFLQRVPAALPAQSPVATPQFVISSGAVNLPKAKGVKKQHVTGVMNKTEAKYRDVLELRKIAGEVLWYAFEIITFKLGPDYRYTPDFMVMLADTTLEIHEVKALDSKGKVLIKEDARGKLIMVSEMTPLRVRLQAYDEKTKQFVEQIIGEKKAA